MSAQDPPEPALIAESVAAALEMLGQAYRGDWSDFDGRSLRMELQELAAVLRSDQPFDLERWAYLGGICPDSQSWIEHCPQATSSHTCPHVEAISARMRTALTDGQDT